MATAVRWLRVAAMVLVGAMAGAGAAHAAAGPWSHKQEGSARLIAATEATGSASVVDAAIEIKLPKGWHTYWKDPGDGGIPPKVSWAGSTNLAAAHVDFPAPVRLPPIAGLRTLGYDNGVVLPVEVTLAHPGEALQLKASLDYASCDTMCVPIHADLTLDLPSGLAAPGKEAASIAAARARVPVAAAVAGIRVERTVVSPATGTARGAVISLRLASQTPLVAPDLFVNTAGSPVPPTVAVTDSGRDAVLRLAVPGANAAVLAGKPLAFTLVDGALAATFGAAPALGSPIAMPGDSGLAAILVIAFLGGLILNLMPCVLPVIALKLMALLRHAGAEQRVARAHLVASAAGIIVSFLVLAGGLAALKAAGAAVGWGIQFQSPWFLAAMALATTLFAAGLFDLLDFGRVAVAGPAAADRGGAWGAFVMGAFATALAASCTAPFVGTALGFALTRGTAQIVAVLGVMGVGMAAPYLAAAAVPGVVALLPRPGRWMVWLRRLFGLGLLATSVWLLWVLALEAGPSAAILAAASLVVLFVLLAWGRRAALAGAVVAAVIALASPALRSPARAEAANWQRFDAAAIPALVAAHKTVFVNVTAAWCLTCKANAIAVLDQAPVAGKLKAPEIVAMQADWTRPDPAISAYLARFRRFGVPLDVVYGPGAKAGIALPELLTSQTVLDALAQASGQK